MRRFARYLFAVTIVLALVACPLPFQFVPEDTTGSAPSSNDPANPSITAAPQLVISEITDGVPVADTPDQVEATRNVQIELVSETPSATFFYRTDGGEPIPGASGTVLYDPDQPIVLDSHLAEADLRAMAIGPSMYPSIVTARRVVVRYDQVEAPSFDPPPGNFQTDQQITISTSTPGATIWYRIVEGTAAAPLPVPGESGSVQYDGTPISVSGTGTARSISAIAVKSEMRDSAASQGGYTIGYDGAAQPSVSPAGGSYTSDVTVGMTPGEVGADVFYTVVDGPGPAPTPQPGEAGTERYTGSFTILGPSAQKSIAAITVAPQMLSSTPVYRTYTVEYPQAAAPQLSLPSGAYHPDDVVEVSTTTAGATLYYTTDGTIPTRDSETISGAVRIGDIAALNGSEVTITVIAAGDNLVASDPVRRTYSSRPIIVVTGEGDTISTDGFVSLREAMTAALSNSPSGDAPAGIVGERMLIDLTRMPGLQSGPVWINLNAALPTITDDLIIQGDRTRPVTVNGRGDWRPFTVTGGFVEFRGFTVTAGNFTGATADAVLADQAGGGGAGGLGGALYINAPGGSVLVDNMVFSDNVAQGGRGGNASTIVTDVGVTGTFSGVNGIRGAGPNGGAGGTSGSVVGGTGGFASGGGSGYGGAPNGSGDGGRGGEFGGGGGGGRGDNAYNGSPGGPGGFLGGAGSYAYSGGAGSGGGGAGVGGAIALVYDGYLAVRNTTFANNSATGGASGLDGFGGSNASGAGRGKGGAVFVYGGELSLGVFSDMDATGVPTGFALATRNDFVAAGNSFSANQASDPAGTVSDNDDVYIDVIQVMF